MERIQFCGENWEIGFSEQGLLGNSEQEEDISSACLEDKMPSLQMLQESPLLLPFEELGFQTLLKLQHFKKPWEMGEQKLEEKIQTFEPDGCLTPDMLDSHSPIKSESNIIRSKGEGNCVREGRNSPKQTQLGKSVVVVREKRKRKRGKPLKDNEEVENQRMTHIAVERNRRRQMNDHLNVLRSLMPSSYIQRGDQASIIGGAINFVKELEQLLQSLESQRRTRNPESSSAENQHAVSSSPPSSIAMASNGSDSRREAADVEVTVIQTHVNLKVQCERRPRQLVEAIVELEKLKLSVLHLNVTTSQSTVLYSFNLKIEDECELRSEDKITGSVHQIFSYING